MAGVSLQVPPKHIEPMYIRQPERGREDFEYLKEQAKTRKDRAVIG